MPTRPSSAYGYIECKEEPPAHAEFGAVVRFLEKPSRSKAQELLQTQPWPGNVRQLANLLERAAILCEGSTLGIGDLKGLLAPGITDERRGIEDALLAAEGDKKHAAESLGVSYRTLQRKIQRYDLEGFPKYRR